MEYVLEFILEFIFEAGMEASRSSKVPKYIRYLLIVLIASVYGGQHASAHVISRVFSVIFNRRTSLYASFIFLENPWNPYGWGRRVVKRHIPPLSRHLSDAYKDVRGVKVTTKEGKYALHRPCCLLYTDTSITQSRRFFIPLFLATHAYGVWFHGVWTAPWKMTQ